MILLNAKTDDWYLSAVRCNSNNRSLAAEVCGVEPWYPTERNIAVEEGASGVLVRVALDTHWIDYMHPMVVSQTLRQV